MTDGSAASYEEIFDTPCLYHFHEWVKERLKEGKKLESLEEELIDKNPDIILISNELGYGVVPIEQIWQRISGNNRKSLYQTGKEE